MTPVFKAPTIAEITSAIAPTTNKIATTGVKSSLPQLARLAELHRFGGAIPHCRGGLARAERLVRTDDRRQPSRALEWCNDHSRPCVAIERCASTRCSGTPGGPWPSQHVLEDGDRLIRHLKVALIAGQVKRDQHPV
jgi:hypothetical protein